MSARCGARYDDYDGECELDIAHDGPHAEGMLQWGGDE